MLTLKDIAHLNRSLIDHAIACIPQEMAGFVVEVEEGLQFYPVTNIHENPSEMFAISAEDYANTSSLGEIKAIVHSHPSATIYNGGLNFSDADKVSCEQTNLPWVLITLLDNQIKILNPSGFCLPLLGREFVYGITDCYGLVRDAFAEINIFLNQYERQRLHEWDENPSWNLYEDFYQKEGFIDINLDGQLQKYDLLLMQVQSKKTNHAGLIWEPERNIFIHHLLDRLSEKCILGGYWKSTVVKACRHKNLC